MGSAQIRLGSSAGGHSGLRLRLPPADRPHVDPRTLLSTNGRIAAALIDVLATSSDCTAAPRALQLAGGDAAALSRGGWLSDEILAAMFRTAAGDARLPERVGQALVCSPQAGLFLRYSGLATPEKAYRRCNQILAREARGALYEVAEVVSGHARVLFHPADGGTPERIYCALRRGMLEAIPTVYGLLPARVRETECVRRGAGFCVFDVHWSSSLRRGAFAGALAGAVSGAVLAAWIGLPLWGHGFAVAVASLICAAAGRSIDLANQLQAVAGARLGQLALLDQADHSLAEKMDQFARLAAVDGAASDRRASYPAEPGTAGLGGVPHVETAGALVGVGGAPDLQSDLQSDFQPVDLVSVVRSAVESQRLGGTTGPTVGVELPEEPMLLDGEPVRLERIVVQLIENAVSASLAQAEATGNAPGSVRVSLQAAGERLELAVEDDGAGIEEEMVDQVFDPFLAQTPARGALGQGLAEAYRVVEEHGGELRLESAAGQGTRITALLPRRQGDSA